MAVYISTAILSWKGAYTAEDDHVKLVTGWDKKIVKLVKNRAVGWDS